MDVAACRGYKRRPSSPFMHRSLALLFAPLLLSAAGCSVLGVRVDDQTSSWRREAAAAVRANGNSPAAKLLARAQQKELSESERAAALVEAAQLSSAARPGTSQHALNIAATRGLLGIMAERSFSPLALPNGATLDVSPETRLTLDPRTADLVVPADGISIKGLRVRVEQDGAGLPCVAHFPAKSAVLRGQAGVPPLAGFCEPVTAVVQNDARGARLVFYRTVNSDMASIGGRRTRLAADFSAPLAFMISKGSNRNIDLRSLVRSDLNIGQMGLYQFSRYDSEKIPVVFVHGLMSRPETWIPAVNELMANKDVRERYQFWFFLYPTGLPVWASAAELRSELDRYRKTFDPSRSNGKFDRMVLAGHSMGGLISSLQIRSGGKALWRQFMETPPDQLNLSPQGKERIARIVKFQPRPEVARVVFFATPHRGSELAVNPFSEFFSRLIRLPSAFVDRDFYLLRNNLREEFRDLFVAPANSLVFLRANSPLLKAILALPMREGVPYHSVIGDRGRGDAPNSSDGVVPYWSSHLQGARSEKVVPSGHGAHENPEGISEFARILKAHR